MRSNLLLIYTWFMEFDVLCHHKVDQVAPTYYSARPLMQSLNKYTH